MADRIESIEDLQDKLSGRQVAMVATRDERGAISSRPITVQKLDDQGSLWFLVNRHAAWVAPADGNAVNASFTGEKNLWVSVSGRLTLDDDRERTEELLGPIGDSFFEGDAEPIMARIKPQEIEWWSAPNSVVQVMDLARSKVSGDSPDAGESGTLRVDR